MTDRVPSAPGADYLPPGTPPEPAQIAVKFLRIEAAAARLRRERELAKVKPAGGVVEVELG